MNAFLRWGGRVGVLLGPAFEVGCSGVTSPEVLETEAGPMVSATGFGACFLDGKGRVDCKDGPYPPPNPNPDTAFRYVSNGDLEVCGIRNDGSLTCWGEKPFEDPGPYVQVDIGGGTCAVRLLDRGVTCWSSDFRKIEVGLPPGRYRKVAVAGHEVWALREDGTLACANTESPCPAIPKGTFLDVDIEVMMCAVHADGSLGCWAEDSIVAPPEGMFTQVSLGGFLYDACALRADRTVACWSTLGRVDMPPKDAFVQLSSGRHFACGTKVDGTFACWGDVPFDL